MADSTFRPNWASPPGDTINSVLQAKGLSLDAFMKAMGLADREASGLLSGAVAITPSIAASLSKAVGSTARFWLERQKQYQTSIKELNLMTPDLAHWVSTFPLKAMIDSGWLPRPASKDDAPFELFDYFAVSSIKEWKEKYLVRLGKTQFRTSEAFENNIAATTAWIRHGELLADAMPCKAWNPKGFAESLRGLKALTKENEPSIFIPQLQQECAKHGVAVVIARCAPGCAASGATCMLDDNRALLLLSGRFLTDDQFWFSFFHEAGHLVLHGKEPHVEEKNSSSPEREAEANFFAQSVILDPEGDQGLSSLAVNKFSISRFARRCDVSPGLIVGQLQNRKKVSPTTFNNFKIRYKASDFIL
jgi:HTH-type transcriptional regulator/antitoxin HigA